MKNPPAPFSPPLLSLATAAAVAAALIMSSQKRRRVLQDDSDSDDDAVSAGAGELPFQEAAFQDDDNSLDRDEASVHSSAPSEEGDVPMDPASDYEEEEDPEGEDLLENAAADYQRIEGLDRYDAANLDNRAYGEMTLEQRRAAEEENARRVARNQGIEELLGDAGEEDDEDKRGRRARFGPKVKAKGEQNIRRRVGKVVGEDADQVVMGRITKYDKSSDLFEVTFDDESTETWDRSEVQMGLDVHSSRQPDDPSGDLSDSSESEDEFDDDLDLNQLGDVPLREFLAETKTRRKIMAKFRKFLATYTGQPPDDDPNPDEDPKAAKKRRKKRAKNMIPVYHQRITTMCANNQQSLEVSFLHLSEASPQLAIYLADAPSDLFELLNQVATKYTFSLFTSYSQIHSDIFVRIANLPISDSLRDLRQVHLNRLIKVSGVCTRRTSVQPELLLAKYDCLRCGYVCGPFRIEGRKEAGPSQCPHCQNTKGFKINSQQTIYKNYQRVTLQEPPSSVPAGRVPRSKDVILENDMIDSCRPGELVEVTGVYVHVDDFAVSERTGFPVYKTVIHANHVLKKEDLTAVEALSEKDKRDILALSKDPKIGEKIVRSIAPSIYGMQHAKRSIAMALFGGVPKNVNGHRIRSDINVLLLGDPGVAKSQLLKYAEKTAPRAVYSTGKGASAVGLTAAVRKDPMTKEWTLEGGALVLADKGICLIDEFDKMNEGDRTSIHEAMEQQSISVSKAGIITSLQARCSVIAAANPIGGRYDSSCTLAENVELTDPILQRFDCLVVLQDVVDPVADELLAKFVTGSHMRSTPTNELADIGRGDGEATRMQTEEMTDNEKELINDRDEVSIPQHLLRKYIQYARTAVHPQLKGFDQDKVASLYADLRRESANNGGLPIAVRHIESVMRMAEAHARMHLREFVREDDVDAAIKTMVESFIQSQKFSVRRALTKGFRKYLVSDDDKTHLLLHALNQLVKENQTYLSLKREEVSEIRVYMDEFEQKAREMNIFDVSGFYASAEFKSASYSIDKKAGAIWRPLVNA